MLNSQVVSLRFGCCTALLKYVISVYQTTLRDLDSAKRMVVIVVVLVVIVVVVVVLVVMVEVVFRYLQGLNAVEDELQCEILMAVCDGVSAVTHG